MYSSLKSLTLGAGVVLAAAACDGSRKIAEAAYDGSREVAEFAGRSVSGTATGLVEGIGNGVTETEKLRIEASPIAEFLGLDSTIAHPINQGITFYLVAETPIQASLVVKAVDLYDKEIGRVKTSIDMGQGDGTYIDAHFPEQMQMNEVKKFIVDVEMTIEAIDPQRLSKEGNRRTIHASQPWSKFMYIRSERY